MAKQQPEKPGRKTSEFVLTVTTAIISGSIGLGIIDPQLIEFGTQALETVQNSSNTDSIQGITDAVFKIVALVVGGNVVSNYTKSRGAAKQGKNDSNSSDEEGENG